MSKTTDPELPRQVLPELCWSFIGPAFSSRSDFEDAVRAYQVLIRKRDDWRPETVVLPRAAVRVRYQCLRDDELADAEVLLTSRDGSPFTAGELLFLVHNAVIADLREMNHHFFEGLSLAGHPAAGEPPTYRLEQGS